MNTYTFDIIVEGLSPGCSDEEFDSVADQLLDAGIEDAILGVRGGCTYVSFERPGQSLVQAAASAIVDLKRSGTALQSIRFESDDLATCAEIAARVGMSPETVRLHAQGKRRGGGFPSPRVLKPVKQWSWSEVALWYGVEADSAAREADTIVNSYLALSTQLQRVSAQGLQPHLDRVLIALLVEPTATVEVTASECPRVALRLQKHGPRKNKGRPIDRTAMRKAPSESNTPAEQPMPSVIPMLINGGVRA